MINTCVTCEAIWRGQHAEHCPICHETFGSARPADMHRVGDHGASSGPNRRRCLTREEMLASTDTQGRPRFKVRPNAYGTDIWRQPVKKPYWEQPGNDPETTGEPGPTLRYPAELSIVIGGDIA